MKSLIVFTVFTSSALASAIQLPNPLVERAIDPATMNPTLFSVLSVLKTGMPTGPNVPLPTGNSQPDWYQRLPGDVKSLLPLLYPVAPTAQAVVAVATSETRASQVVSQVVSSALPSSVAVSSTETTVVSASPPASSSVLSSSASASASAASSSSSSAIDSLSSKTLASQDTLTKTLQSMSLATNTQSPSSSAPSSGSTSQTPSSAASTSASATPSNFISAGARSAAKTEALAIMAFFSVGAGFCIFA